MTGRILLASGELSVGELDGVARITILRTGDTSGAVRVEFNVTADTATAGADFTPLSGTVTIPAGADRAVVAVPILDDALGEATERLAFSIVNVSSGSLGAPRTAQIDILDDENPVLDPPDPPETSDYTVIERPATTATSAPIDIVFSPTDPDVAFVAEKGGRIRVFDTEAGEFRQDFIDLSSKVNDWQDRGLLSIALHPDFPSNPYVYAFYVADPDEAAQHTGNRGQDGAGNRYSYLVRFEADASEGYLKAKPGSETILLGGAGQGFDDISEGGRLDFTDPANVNYASSERVTHGDDEVVNGLKQDYMKVDSASHAGGALAFGPDGMLYVSTGDGTSFDITDPRTFDVQNLDSLSGKILRIDPLTGDGAADNPFATGDLDSNRSKVWQYGLRNPFRMAFDAEHRLMISETGWYTWEEINTGGPGANFGWPGYEGADGGVLAEAPSYRHSAEAQAFYAAVERGDITVTPAFRAFAHDSDLPGYQVQAITGGSVVYDGDAYPASLQGKFFFSDVAGGDVYVVDTADRRDLALLYDRDDPWGAVSFTQDAEGYVWYIDLVGNEIGRLEISGGPTGPDNEPPVAANDAFAIDEDRRLKGNVLKGPGADADPDGDRLRVVLVEGLALGQTVTLDSGARLTMAANGRFVYDPRGAFDLAEGFAATDAFTYTVSDGKGGTATATATVAVDGVGQPGDGPGEGFSVVDLQDWYDPGSDSGLYIATFRYTVPDTVPGGSVSDWTIKTPWRPVDGTPNEAWTVDYAGDTAKDLDGRIKLSTTGPAGDVQLDPGDTITFAVRIDGAPFDADTFDFTFVDRDKGGPVDPPPDDHDPGPGVGFTFVDVSEWYGPDGKGTFIASFRYTVPDDVPGGAVTDWIIRTPWDDRDGNPELAWTVDFPRETIKNLTDKVKITTLGVADKVTLRPGDTIEFAVKMTDARFDVDVFDFKFIDADAGRVIVNANTGRYLEHLPAEHGARNSLADLLADRAEHDAPPLPLDHTPRDFA